MSQVNVQCVATDELDYSITLLVGSQRYEFFLGDRYHSLNLQLAGWLSSGWNNYAVAKLVEAAQRIEPSWPDARSTTPPWSRRSKKKQEVSTMSNFKKEPSAEFPFTVIAPHAKSLSYNGDRKWFTTQDDATQFAGEVYESENKSFELCIVQCVDVVKPKPKTVLMSTWNSAPTLEHQADTTKSGS